MKKSLVSLLFASVVYSNTVLAVDPVYTGFFSDTAIKGYDTVAYFTENAPREGVEAYSYEYKGATWLFVSAEHRQLFIENPDKYAPQYGGYCAYAVAKNATASIQPDLFTVLKGKLYLNNSPSINQKWNANKDAYIQSADQNWPLLLTQ